MYTMHDAQYPHTYIPTYLDTPKSLTHRPVQIVLLIL